MFGRDMSALGRMRDGPMSREEKRVIQLLRGVDAHGKGGEVVGS